jgi:hypothetical protein
VPYASVFVPVDAQPITDVRRRGTPFASRLPDTFAREERRVRAAALAGAARACLETTHAEWVGSDGARSPSELLGPTMSAVDC